MKTVIQALASAIQARRNCIERNNLEWKAQWENTIFDIEKNYLPHGSGFDAGCKVDLDRSNQVRVVFQADYHQMDENGYYDGWTDHTVTVTPEFGDICIRINGRDVRGFKDYAHDVLRYALQREYRAEALADAQAGNEN